MSAGGRLSRTGHTRRDPPRPPRPGARWRGVACVHWTCGCFPLCWVTAPGAGGQPHRTGSSRCVCEETLPRQECEFLCSAGQGRGTGGAVPPQTPRVPAGAPLWKPPHRRGARTSRAQPPLWTEQPLGPPRPTQRLDRGCGDGTSPAPPPSTPVPALPCGYPAADTAPSSPAWAPTL